jgi:aspartate-semialdehyde dehydrogenase
MSNGYRVAVAGATGQVGTLMLALLGERSFPAREIVPFASERSVGRELDGGLVVHGLSEESIQGFDLVLFSAGGGISGEWAPRFRDAGAIVIDNSSRWRMQDDVPLVVSEVNPGGELAARLHVDGLGVAVEDGHAYACGADADLRIAEDLARLVDQLALLVGVVLPCGERAGMGQHVERDLVSVGLGRGDLALVEQRVGLVEQLIDGALAGAGDGLVGGDHKPLDPGRVVQRLQRHDHLHRRAVGVRHDPAVTGERLEHARELLAAAPGVTVLDDPGAALYPLAIDATGSDEVFVGRIRRDPGHERALDMWIVADNLRKGAATNAVQLAELLRERRLLRQFPS